LKVNEILALACIDDYADDENVVDAPSDCPVSEYFYVRELQYVLLVSL
jgi:hypothetical protein